MSFADTQPLLAPAFDLDGICDDLPPHVTRTQKQKEEKAMVSQVGAKRLTIYRPVPSTGFRKRQ